jgi:hypothetical protein
VRTEKEKEGERGERERERERERDKVRGRCPWCFFRVYLLPKTALKRHERGVRRHRPRKAV